MKNSELKKFIKTNIKKLQESSMLNENKKCCGGWDPGGTCSTSVGGTQYHGNYDCSKCSCMSSGGDCLFGDCVGGMVTPGGVTPIGIEPADLDIEPRKPTINKYSKKDDFDVVREAANNLLTESCICYTADMGPGGGNGGGVPVMNTCSGQGGSYSVQPMSGTFCCGAWLDPNDVCDDSCLDSNNTCGTWNVGGGGNPIGIEPNINLVSKDRFVPPTKDKGMKDMMYQSKAEDCQHPDWCDVWSMVLCHCMDKKQNIERYAE